MRVYDSIYKNLNNESNIAIEDDYTLSDLKELFIAHNSENRKYYCFNNVKEFLKFYKNEKQKTYHEVIFSVPQKLKFDFDAKSTDITYEKFINYIEETICVIRDAFFINFGLELNPKYIIRCESKCSRNSKFSYHIIIDNYCVENQLIAKQFTADVVKYVSNKNIIDLTVNKKVQNFRIAESHKNNRIKKILTKHTLSQSLITNTSKCKLVKFHLYITPQNESINTYQTDDHLHPDDKEQIINICKEKNIFDNHDLRTIKNNLFIFERKNASYCELCDRVHDSDNTVLISALRTDENQINIYQTCRKYKSEHKQNKSINLGCFYSNMITQKTSTNATKYKKNMIKTYIDDNCDKDLIFEQSLADNQKNIYNDKKLKEFELDATILIVRAAMKMGKTKALKNYLQRINRMSKIRMLSFRQTFSSNIKYNFPDFTLYNEVKGKLNQDKLIIQIESLHRLEINDEAPDLLILDECESIFEQFHANLFKDYECFSKFQYLIKFSKKIICMDANVSSRTFNILKQMRPNFINDVYYHYNTYDNMKDDIYYLISDKVQWLDKLYKKAKENKIAIPISSLEEAKSLEFNLHKRFPQKNIKLYSSETLQSERRKHFGDVNKYWAEYDILIYTPTISAGISFEVNHFDYIFGYFVDTSCNVETCSQMIGRIRSVKTKEHYICISATGCNLPQTTNEIKEEILESRRNLYRCFENGILVKYNKEGERICEPIDMDYFTLHVENIRINNLSRNSFIKRFIYLKKQYGARLELINEELDEVSMDLLKESKEAKQTIKKIRVDKIFKAKDITDDEYDAIKKKMQSISESLAEDINEIERYEFERYNLRRTYKFYEDLTKNFISNYNEKKVRIIYKNLCKIKNLQINDALKEIQEEERNRFEYYRENNYTKSISMNIMFNKHRYALSLLHICGWNSLYDNRYISKENLLHNIKNSKQFNNIMKLATKEFKFKYSDIYITDIKKFPIERIIKPINIILRNMYGATINSENGKTMFCINTSKLFTFNETVSNSKKIPLIR